MFNNLFEDASSKIAKEYKNKFGGALSEIDKVTQELRRIYWAENANLIENRIQSIMKMLDPTETGATLECYMQAAHESKQVDLSIYASVGRAFQDAALAIARIVQDLNLDESGK